MSAPETPTTKPGRRAAVAPRGRDPLTLLAVAVPVLTVLAALLVHTEVTPVADRAPVQSPLTRVDVICPPANGPVVVASLAGDGGGSVSAQVGTADPRRLPVGQHTPVEVSGASGGAGDAVVLTGREQAAPGLLAGRFATPVAAADCRVPLFDQWFTGVGAGAKHSSTLQLVNPDGSRALVDVEVLTSQGAVDVPDLRGLAVPAHETVSVELGEVVPRGDDLALHVTTLRGRVGASIADAFDKLGGLGSGTDALSAQEDPRTTNVLLGLPGGGGRRNLVLANPGDDQGRASVQLITESSTFAPEGGTEVKLPPHSVVRLKIGDVVRSAAGEQAAGERLVGLRIDSTVPVTADLLMFLDGDLTHATALERLDADTDAAAVLPDADNRLLLAGATRPGVVTVQTWDADGTALPDQRVEVGQGNGAITDLPAEARLVRLRPSRTSISAVVLTTVGAGKKASTALVQLRVPQTTGLVPQVGPGLP